MRAMSSINASASGQFRIGEITINRLGYAMRLTGPGIWVRALTLVQLLRHYAGFTRSASTSSTRPTVTVPTSRRN